MPEDPTPMPPQEPTPTDVTRPAQEERTWAMVAHLVGVASSFLLPVIVSLVIYMVKKDESEFIADQAREALNFQITVVLAAIVALLSFFCAIGVVLYPLVGLASVVFGIIGAIRSYDGVQYRYPVTLRLV